MSSRIVLFLALLPAVVILTGCGDGPDAKFVVNDNTKSLSPKAKAPVEKALKDNFGTPENLVAWERLPVNFGGVEAQVVEVNVDDNTSSFKIEAPKEIGDIRGYTEFQWVSGKYATADKTLNVRSYDPEKKIVTLVEKLEQPPEKGDRCLIKAGDTLKDGRRLYMTHCEHCHGVSGDGNGPTAKYLEPLPRDYRLGVFKFTSTVPRGRPGDKVRRDDLTRIVRHGIPGTYMPSFLLMPDHDLAAIIEYVRFLAMRGEFENKLDADLISNYSVKAIEERTSGENPEKPEEIFANIQGEVTESIDRGSNEIAEAWTLSEKEESVVVPTKKRTSEETNPDSIARGRALFLSAKAKCVSCHGVTGRGDGANTETVQAGKTKPGLFDDWGHKIKPRDLTTGIFRGGRRPIDIYRRIRSGIKGTPMPPFGADLLTDEEVWDLVNYVLMVPHEVNGTAVTEKQTPTEKPAEEHASK